MNVGVLVRSSVVVARGDEHIFEAARRMRDQHVGCLVVVEDEDDGMHPIGVVTDLDLLLAIIGTGAEHVEGLRLAELMSWDVLVANRGDDADEAEWLGNRLAELTKLVTSEQRRVRGLRP